MRTPSVWQSLRAGRNQTTRERRSPANRGRAARFRSGRFVEQLEDRRLLWVGGALDGYEWYDAA